MTGPAPSAVPLEAGGPDRRLLAITAFRRLWLAGGLSATGHQIVRMALILHLAGTREGVWAVALYVALDTVPGALAAPLAGPLVDRWPKPAVMIGSDLARIGLALCILAAPRIGVIYAATALHSVASAFFHPAKRAAIPQAVEARRLDAANGADQSAGHLVFVVAPIVGAELYLGFGLAAVLAAHAVFHLASAALLRGLRLGAPAGRSSAAADPAEPGGGAAGWRPLLADPRVRLLLALSCLSMFATGIWLPLAPTFLAEVLGGGARSLAWQIGLTGLGAALGALWAPRWTSRYGKGRVLLAAFVAEGLALTVYALVGSLVVSMLLMVLWGVVVSMISVPFHSLLQVGVRRELLGRVFTLVQQSENLALLAATCAAILVAPRMPAETAFLAVGLLYAAGALAASRTRAGRAVGAQP